MRVNLKVQFWSDGSSKTENRITFHGLFRCLFEVLFSSSNNFSSKCGEELGRRASQPARRRKTSYRRPQTFIMCSWLLELSLLVTLTPRHKKHPNHCEAQAYFISNNDRIMCVIHAWWLSKYKKFHFSGDNEKRKMNGQKKRRKNKYFWCVFVSGAGK